MKSIMYNKAVLFIAGLIVGLFLMVQYRQGGFQYYFVSINDLQQLSDNIQSTKDEMIKMKALIRERKKELRIMQEAMNNGDVRNVLNDEIQNAKNIAGMTDLTGQGVMIRITDGDAQEGENIRNYVVHDADILKLINDLKVAGAEAISIKGQRVTARSEIHCGGPIIWINKRSVTTPFVINAIGNPKQLYAAINGPNTNGDALKYYINIDTKISDNILVPKYSKEIDFVYAKPIGEGD